MGTLSEVEEDFIGETLDILTDLCRSCGELDGPGTAKERCRNIERGLHTIKGNSPAFGFEEFGAVAAALLEKVKRVSASEGESREIAPLVLEFVTRSRQYLGLVREGRSRPFFGGIFKSLRDQLDQDPASRDRSMDLVEPHDRTRRSARARDESPRAEESRGRAGSKKEPSLKAKLEAILATAPPVQPNLEELSKLAARRLKLRPGRAVADDRPSQVAVASSRRTDARETPAERERSTSPTAVSPVGGEPASRGAHAMGAASDQLDPARLDPARPEMDRPEMDRPEMDRLETASPKPPRAGETSGHSSEPAPGTPALRVAGRGVAGAGVAAGEVAGAEVAGLALEALRARDAAALVSAAVEEDAHLRRHMARISEFLADFCSWARRRQLAPLQDSLDRCVADLEALAARMGLDVTVSAERTSLLALPLLGQLAEQAVTELLRGFSLLWKRGQGRRSLALSASESSGRVEIRIAGAGSSSALAARLRILPVKRRLEEIGGDLVTSASDDELVVVLPDNLQSMEVCVVRSGESRVGLPGHRVADTKLIRRDEAACAAVECRFRLDDEEIAVLDLAGIPVRDGADPAERCLVVLRGESGHHGLIVDEFLGRQEMLVVLEAGFGQGGDIAGSCFAALDGETVPLLDFKAPRDMAAEGHRS